MSTTGQSIISQQKGQNEPSSEKEIFFIILKPSEEKVNLDLKFSSENSPQIIHKNRIEKEKDSYLEYNVFKLNIKKNEKREKDKKENKKKRKTQNRIYGRRGCI